MKVTHRIPTEQFAYIEFTDEYESIADAVHAHSEAHRLYKGGEGMEHKEWNKVLDNYLWGTGTMVASEYEAMSPAQQSMIQEIKKSRNRK